MDYTLEQVLAMKPLTVAELIEHLRTLPQDSFVVIDGYEWGVGRLPVEAISTGFAHELGDNKETFPVVYIERQYSPDTEDLGFTLRMCNDDGKRQ